MISNIIKKENDSLGLIKKLFVSILICRGKKLLAEKLFFSLLVEIKQKYKEYRNFDILYISVLNLRPLLNLKIIKIGALKCKVPVLLSNDKQKLYAVKLLINSVRSENGISVDKLSEIMFLTFMGMKNVALDKKLNLYREIINSKVYLKFVK